jgi:hypothetical protein
MIHFSNAERPALLDMQKLRMDQAWRKGLIGDATYVRSLSFYGYLPNDANTELSLLKLEKRPCVQSGRS